MNIQCQYKQCSEGFDAFITCRLRYPFMVALTTDEKSEIVHSISSIHNVPKRYSEIYNSIKQMLSGLGRSFRKDFVLTTKGDGSCCVDVMLFFHSDNHFKNFIRENNLIAELF